jgi:hypothetical protein
LIGRALVQQHPKRRRLVAIRAPSIPAELRRDVRLVEVCATDEPPESYRDFTAWPAARTMVSEVSFWSCSAVTFESLPSEAHRVVAGTSMAPDVSLKRRGSSPLSPHVGATTSGGERTDEAAGLLGG